MKCCMTSLDISTSVQVIEWVPDNHKMTDKTPRLPETSASSFNDEPCNLVMNQYDKSAAYEAIPLPSNLTQPL